MSDSVPGRLWREHSPRAFHTSCTTCLRYPNSWHDAIGGGSPEPQGYGKDHAKTHRTEAKQIGQTAPVRCWGRREGNSKKTCSNVGGETSQRKSSRRLARAGRFITEEKRKMTKDGKALERGVLVAAEMQTKRRHVWRRRV